MPYRENAYVEVPEVSTSTKVAVIALSIPWSVCEDGVTSVKKNFIMYKEGAWVYIEHKTLKQYVGYKLESPVGKALHKLMKDTKHKFMLEEMNKEFDEAVTEPWK